MDTPSVAAACVALETETSDVSGIVRAQSGDCRHKGIDLSFGAEENAAVEQRGADALPGFANERECRWATIRYLQSLLCLPSCSLVFPERYVVEVCVHGVVEDTSERIA